MSITRLARLAVGRTAEPLLREVLVRGAHEREQIEAGSENPIIVPSAAQVRARVEWYFETAHRYERALHGLDFRLEDPDWHGDPAAEQHLHVDPARAAAHEAAIALIADLVSGGRPPWRWTLQRWTRRAAHLRWYLREQQRKNPCGGCDPWASAPLAGSSTSSGNDEQAPF